MLKIKRIIKNIYKIIDKFGKQLEKDAVYAFAAQAAFFIIIAFFPFIMLVLTVIEYIPDSGNDLKDILFSIMPGGTSSFMANVMGDIHDKASGPLISITAFTTLWSASSGVYALMRGIISVYKVKETRSYIRLKAASVIYTVVFIFMLIITMGILVFGNSIQSWIESQIPHFTGVVSIIINVRTIVGIIALTIFSLILYILIPNRKTRAKDELPGAVLSGVGWVVFSYAYSFYITNINNSSYFYGSMTAIVFLMLWLNFCMYIMLVGAELNVYLKERS